MTQMMTVTLLTRPCLSHHDAWRRQPRPTCPVRQPRPARLPPLRRPLRPYHRDHCRPRAQGCCVVHLERPVPGWAGRGHKGAARSGTSTRGRWPFCGGFLLCRNPGTPTCVTVSPLYRWCRMHRHDVVWPSSMVSSGGVHCVAPFTLGAGRHRASASNRTSP